MLATHFVCTLLSLSFLRGLYFIQDTRVARGSDCDDFFRTFNLNTMHAQFSYTKSFPSALYNETEVIIQSSLLPRETNRECFQCAHLPPKSCSVSPKVLCAGVWLKSTLLIASYQFVASIMKGH